MTIDIDILGKDLAMYRGRMDEHLKAATAYDNAAKESRARASACAGAIEAVQRLMDLAKGEDQAEAPAADAPAPVAESDAKPDEQAQTEGDGHEGN